MKPSDERWPLEELVRAQCLACEGWSIAEIAQALGRTNEDVRTRLEPQALPDRPESAGIAFAHMKPRR
jgi:hypothetical protein